MMFPVDRYVLGKIGLARVACPAELMARMENRSKFAPMILEKNRKRYGEVQAVGYVPPVVVIAGAERRRMLLERGIVASWAWVEKGAMEIKADDAISTAELTEKLSAKLNEKLNGREEPIPGQSWPFIVEIYPFENYMIYSLKGQKYRQAFFLHPIERRVAFVGNSIPVEEKFVDARAYVAPIQMHEVSAYGDVMPRVETGVRYSSAPVVGHSQTSSRGASRSELYTQVIRNWTNINSAVQMYLNALKAGMYKPMRPSFCPVELTDDGHIAGRLAAQGVEISDFVRWTDSQKRSRANWNA